MSDDEKEISYYTVQLYSNGDQETLKRWSHTFLAQAGDGVYIDVDPRMGRVLVFEQGDLIHSGEEVTSGIKYNIQVDMLYVEEIKAS